ALARETGLRVVATRANKGVGVDELKDSLKAAVGTKAPTVGPRLPDPVDREATALRDELGGEIPPFLARPPVLDVGGYTGRWVGAQVEGAMGAGRRRSLLADGVIVGVGGVVKFLPQILILFGFIAVLEDCGYMARAAFLMDRLMSRCGLSGKSFIPLLSSVAC